MSSIKRPATLPSLALLVLAAWCAACSREPSAAPAAGAHAANGPDATPVSAIARGRVDVEGGLLQLNMPVEGRLVDVAVREGDRVKRGQVLASADATTVRIQLETLNAKLESARAQQANLEVRLELGRKRAERLAEAATSGAGDGQSADDARDSAAQLAAELEELRATERIAKADLEQARYLLAQHTLRAPADAQVVRVAAQPGMTVSPQSPALFTLLPESPRIVRAELNETFIASVRVGMQAKIMADDDSQAPVALAKVLRVGSTFAVSTLEDGTDPRVGERSVECVLSLDGASSLRVGQRVLVRFGQER